MDTHRSKDKEEIQTENKYQYTSHFIMKLIKFKKEAY